jgi:ankyrin repeat protein
MVLHDLIYSNQLEVLRQYFKTSPEKARSQINAPNEDGFTPLMLALHHSSQRARGL